jgi:uncharacterized protein (TIGR02453 family)
VFSGFPADGLDFLRELEEHNDRAWFEAHRRVWDDGVVPALLEWCSELAERLRDAMPGLVCVPRVGGSVLHLNRDVRFSRDKRPYETRACAVLWEGEDRHDAPSMSLAISPGEVMFQGGMAVFEEGRLDRYRKLLADGASLERLEAALGEGRKRGLRVAGERLPRTPRGFDPEGPLAQLSRQLGLIMVRTVGSGAWVQTREALERSEEMARGYAPLHRWLRDELCR